MRIRSLFSVLALSLVATILLAPVSYGQDARVSGTVLDADGTPVPGVNVMLVRAEEGTRVRGASTDVDGTFSIGPVEPGSYRLEASAVGYAASSIVVTLTSGTEEVTFRLEGQRYGLDEVVVSATRARQELGNVASSVSILNPVDLETQSAVTGDLGDMLAQTVPGLAPSNGALSNFGQTLRGRSPFVLIDGVPQTTPLRDGARSLRTTSPETIERIEVIRGASALYGYGATGGATPPLR